MTEQCVAICTEVAVNVSFALGNDLVDRRAVFQPIKVEVLPEGGGTHIKHRAPILSDVVERADEVARKRFCLEQIVTEESGIIDGKEYIAYSKGPLLLAHEEDAQNPLYKINNYNLVDYASAGRKNNYTVWIAKRCQNYTV